MKQLFFVLSLIGMAILMGCSPEIEHSRHPDLPNGKVNVSFFTNLTRFSTPSTRTGSAQENTLSTTLWAYVFKGVPNVDKVLASIEEVEITVDGLVTLQIEPTGSPVTIVFVANAPATFLDKNQVERSFNEITTGSYTAYDELREELNTILLASPQTTVPYANNSLIPMSGQIDLPDGIPSTNSLIGSINLRRMVAKITVENQTDAFLLVGATVGNAPRNGQILSSRTALKDNTGNLTYYAATEEADPVAGIARAIPGSGIVRQTTAPDPIYIYESGVEDKTCVIIKGSYQGNVQTYYKLRMTQSYLGSDLEEYPANLYKRNFAYKFIVHQVEGNGYTTLEAALLGTFSNNISAILDVTDLSSHEIIDNGEYYLGLSNSEFRIFHSGELRDVLVSTVAFNDLGLPHDIVISDCLGERPVITNNPFSSIDYPGELRVHIAENFRQCQMRLTYGNLSKTISIQRENSQNGTGQVLYSISGADYVHGKIERMSPDGYWIGFSTLDNPDAYPMRELLNKQGGIYVIIQPGGSIPREADFYLARKGQAGRMKVNLQQVR